jgi:eukaryotic-like serine/threonine-protein kinase
MSGRAEEEKSAVILAASADTEPSAFNNAPPAGDKARPAPAGNVRLDLGDRYTKVSVLGRGGMGTVLAARDQVLRREIAVKVLDPKLQAVPELMEGFVEEAKLTAQLDHPNIVPVHDFGHDGSGSVYFTMRRIRGKTLHDVLQDPVLMPGSSERLSVALEVFLKVCDAVAFAHSRGVLHRDIKPENVMVGSFGEVYLVDWGVASVLKDRSGAVDLSRPPDSLLAKAQEWMVGTPQYMAPEMARSEMHLVDERTDIFGLGAMLYEIVTGQAPYDGPEDEVLERARACKAPPPSAFREAYVPQHLSRVVMKAMAESREDRYQTATELASQVRELLHRGLHLPRRNVPQGTIIVSEGEPADCAYIITRGVCEVYKVVKGERRLLRRMGPGSLFGESALMADLRRSATVQAVTDVTILVLARQEMEQSFASDTWEGLLVKTLIERFRELDAKLNDP